MINTVKGLIAVNEQMIFWNSLAFSMSQWMLAIWSLVPLPFLNLPCTSESSGYMYYWNLAWKILSIPCQPVKWMQLYGNLNILWHCSSLELEWKLTFSSAVATVFQICWHIECSSLTAPSFRIWNSSTGILSPPLGLFIAMLPKAHLTSHSRMSGSRWVTTPSWLSGSLRPLLYSSCVYSYYPNIFCFC